MKTVTFIDAVQARVARIACGVSATRGQGAGVVEAGRNCLSHLPLKIFAVSQRSLFEQRLDYATDLLCNSFPKKARSWGLARKILNIFLRDAFYTSYLVDKHALNKVEDYFEIPLDSITARKLREDGCYGSLPRWPGVKYLNSEVSELYQLCALDMAGEFRIARVHLDTYWWGYREE